MFVLKIAYVLNIFISVEISKNLIDNYRNPRKINKLHVVSTANSNDSKHENLSKKNQFIKIENDETSNSKFSRKKSQEFLKAYSGKTNFAVDTTKDARILQLIQIIQNFPTKVSNSINNISWNVDKIQFIIQEMENYLFQYFKSKIHFFDININQKSKEEFHKNCSIELIYSLKNKKREIIKTINVVFDKIFNDSKYSLQKSIYICSRRFQIKNNLCDLHRLSTLNDLELLKDIHQYTIEYFTNKLSERPSQIYLLNINMLLDFILRKSQTKLPFKNLTLKLNKKLNRYGLKDDISNINKFQRQKNCSWISPLNFILFLKVGNKPICKNFKTWLFLNNPYEFISIKFEDNNKLLFSLLDIDLICKDMIDKKVEDRVAVGTRGDDSEFNSSKLEEIQMEGIDFEGKKMIFEELSNTIEPETIFEKDEILLELQNLFTIGQKIVYYLDENYLELPPILFLSLENTFRKIVFHKKHTTRNSVDRIISRIVSYLNLTNDNNEKVAFTYFFENNFDYLLKLNDQEYAEYLLFVNNITTFCHILLGIIEEIDSMEHDNRYLGVSQKLSRTLTFFRIFYKQLNLYLNRMELIENICTFLARFQGFTNIIRPESCIQLPNNSTHDPKKIFIKVKNSSDVILTSKDTVTDKNANKFEDTNSWIYPMRFSIHNILSLLEKLFYIIPIETTKPLFIKFSQILQETTNITEAIPSKITVDFIYKILCNDKRNFAPSSLEALFSKSFSFLLIIEGENYDNYVKLLTQIRIFFDEFHKTYTNLNKENLDQTIKAIETSLKSTSKYITAFINILNKEKNSERVLQKTCIFLKMNQRALSVSSPSCTGKTLEDKKDDDDDEKSERKSRPFLIIGGAAIAGLIATFGIGIVLSMKLQKNKL